MVTPSWTETGSRSPGWLQAILPGAPAFDKRVCRVSMREMLLLEVVEVMCLIMREAPVRARAFGFDTKAQALWLKAATRFMHSAIFNFILIFDIQYDEKSRVVLLS